MSGIGTFTILGQINSLLTGQKNIGPITVANAQAVAVTETIDLADGNTTVNVPDGTTAVLVVPDPSNSGVLALKGINADTGIEISPLQPLLFCPASSDASTFVINSDTADNTVEVVYL